MEEKGKETCVFERGRLPKKESTRLKLFWRDPVCAEIEIDAKCSTTSLLKEHMSGRTPGLVGQLLFAQEGTGTEAQH